MATRRWLGTAQDIAQVDTCTAANTWATGDTATVTIGAVSVTVTVGTASATTDVVAAMTAAINGAALVGDETRNTTGDLHPEFSWITASTSGSTCILTADASGRPFTATASEVTAGTGTFTLANTTVATGKNYWTDTENWSGTTLPVNSDVIVFDNGSVDCLYGIDISATALGSAELHIKRGYTGRIGLPETNADIVGSTYAEYRDTYLKTDIGNVVIGQGESGAASGFIRLDCDSNATTISVHRTGTSSETGKSAVAVANINGGAVYAYSGTVSVDAVAGQASLDVDVRIGYDTSVASDATVYVGPGAVLTNLNCYGGASTIESASLTNLTMWGGTVSASCTPLTNATVYAGTLQIVSDAVNSTVAGTTWIVAGTGSIDISRALGLVTLVNPLDVYGQDSSFSDPTGNWSSSVIDLWQGASVDQLTLAPNVRLTLGTPA